MRLSFITALFKSDCSFMRESKGESFCMKCLQLKVSFSTYSFIFLTLLSFSHPVGHPRAQFIGMWNQDLGLELFNHMSMFERRQNLSGITIVNTVLSWVPLSTVEKDGNSNIYQTGKKSFTHLYYRRPRLQ